MADAPQPHEGMAPDVARAEIRRLRQVLKARDLEVAGLKERLFTHERSAELSRAIHAQQQHRLRVLAAASELLSSSLDSRKALAELARTVVPAMADWCSVDELGPNDEIRRIVLEHRDPDMVQLADDLARRYPQDPESDRGVAHVLRTGRTDWAPDIPDELLEKTAKDPEHLAMMRKLELGSYAVVAIKSRGRILGALTLVSGGSRRVSREDVDFAEELARRAGPALENARLYEKAERARADLFDLLMDVPAAIALLRGPELRYELLNRMGRAIIGREDVIGRPVDEAVPDLPGSDLAALHHVLDTGEPYSGRELRLALGPGRSGERYFNVEYHPTFDDQGEVDGVFTYAFDVTDHVLARRRAESLAAELASNEARLRGLLEAAAAVVWTADPSGKNTSLSDGWQALTGQDTSARSPGDRVHPEDWARATSRWQDAVAAGEPYSGEIRIQRQDGTWVRTISRAVPVRGADGAVTEYIGCNIVVGPA